MIISVFGQILAFTTEKLTPFKPVNCHKKTTYMYSQKITPLHSACLNPNVAYLKQVIVGNIEQRFCCVKY